MWNCDNVSTIDDNGRNSPTYTIRGMKWLVIVFHYVPSSELCSYVGEGYIEVLGPVDGYVKCVLVFLN